MDRILRIAEKIMPQLKLRFKRSDKVEPREYNSIHSDLQRFAATVSRNEELEATVARTDSEDEMTILVEFASHEARGAVMEEMERQARKLAKKAGIELKVE